MSTAPGSDNDAGGAARHAIAIGATLRAARERCDLQIEQVAQQLHLSRRVIAAIEDDDEAALPEPIFVKGYLRAYARLVGVPADDLVRRYCASEPELPPLSVVGLRPKPTLFRLPSARLIRNLIVAVLLGILAWLAYPVVQQFIAQRKGGSELQQPGRFDLPPVYVEPRPGSSGDSPG